LASARVLIGSGHIANALFFCQQAAEKSLKAFLTWHERAFRRTHDLEELGEACRAIDGTLARNWSRRTFFRITHGSCVTRERSTPPSWRKRRLCSPMPPAFSGKSSRDSRWRQELRKIAADCWCEWLLSTAIGKRWATREDLLPRRLELGSPTQGPSRQPVKWNTFRMGDHTG
jgi:hypothetical protein